MGWVSVVEVTTPDLVLDLGSLARAAWSPGCRTGGSRADCSFDSEMENECLLKNSLTPNNNGTWKLCSLQIF